MSMLEIDAFSATNRQVNGLPRQILAVAGAIALSLGTPAVASAAQSFVVSSPTGFPAGGDPSYTTTQNLDTSQGAPGKVMITLAPGVLASLAANPSCVKGSVQYTSACQIGTGSASTSLGVGLSLTAYLVPPPDSSSAAGIDLVTNAPGVPPTHVAVALVQTAAGNVASVLKLDLSGLGPLGGQLTKMSLTVNGILGAKPFTRMPSNCNVSSHSSLTVQYANATETTLASPDFAPTGCSSLPFSPQVTASAVKDAHDPGVKVVTSQTQPLGEAAGLSTTLQLPWPAIIANTAALPLQNTSTPIGTAVATSPLQPTPLSGFAYLTGPTPFTPTLTLKFPPPVALTLVGKVDLNAHTVTFPALPDVPQTGLVVTLFGGAKAAEAATCAPPGGILHASNTGQNGKVATAALPLTVVGCPTVPKLTAVSLSGLAQRRPGLSFKLLRGNDAPNLKSVTVSLPRGLTVKPKHLGKGISVSAPSRFKLSGGQLTITLKGSAATLSVRISTAALLESKQLQQLVGMHKDNPTRQLRFTVTDADGSASTLTG
jgi:hypothetical protein